MMEFFYWLFSSFWNFVGFVVLIVVIKGFVRDIADWFYDRLKRRY